MSDRGYRIALLVDDLNVPKWVRDFADWAVGHPLFELAAVIVQDPGTRTKVFDNLIKLETRLAFTNEYRPYAGLHSISKYAPVQFLRRTAITAEFEIDRADLSKVEGFKLDAIVRCGRTMPRGAILDASKDGIISVLTSTDRAQPGSEGFAEVLEGRPETAFTIERLRHDDEPREIFFKGSVATALLHAWNMISLHARAFPYLQLTLERLATGAAHPLSETKAQVQHVRASDVLRYGLRTTARSLGKAVRRYSGQEFNWQVAFLREGWSNSNFERGRIIPNPEGTFLADPFTLNVGGIDYLFVEEFPFETRKGVISAYRIEGEEVERIGVVLEEPHHLSFPFVFQHGDEIYMVPESGANRAVTLYKSVNFPTEWSAVKVLMADVPAVDTILFRKKSLWWMLTTIQGEGPGLNNAELHAFYARDLLGEWIPHKQNPIVMDASKGRNGGFLRQKDGTPCRVAQVPGFTFYGAGSAVYRIDELSPEVYRESLIKEVHPDFFPELDGTHHIHSSKKFTVYDFMRVERPGYARDR
jgi:hypothetical protein